MKCHNGMEEPSGAGRWLQRPETSEKRIADQADNKEDRQPARRRRGVERDGPDGKDAESKRASTWKAAKRSTNLASTRNMPAMEEAIKALMEEQKQWLQLQIVEQNQRIAEQQQQFNQQHQQMMNQIMARLRKFLEAVSHACGLDLLLLAAEPWLPSVTRIHRTRD
ncbi:hypothetical protein Cgig2_026206 [Carnegiea gigantea]|uniref:Uncharacterized protein n=1 Tax=Carnegiea gigantea TaxID=171969 RepID=A0A9Q1GUA9_9CARY|nr:hypothetical protein Cgig2_026206 [Carnegiea gigantea]